MGYFDGNLYYSPEKFGLEQIGEVVWREPDYSFDFLVLWRRAETERFYFDEDSGCSCPSPFENATLESLTQVESLRALKAHLRARTREECGPNSYNANDFNRVTEECNRLLELAREKGLR